MPTKPEYLYLFLILSEIKYIDIIERSFTECGLIPEYTETKGNTRIYRISKASAIEVLYEEGFGWALVDSINHTWTLFDAAD